MKGKGNMTELQKFATQIRVAELKCLKTRGFGHVGGSLSMTDLLAALYGKIMKYDPQNPNWEDRDRLVISKGHAGPAAYATLALKGFFPIEWLDTLNQPHTNLPSHCDMNKTPGIDMSTGSLGQGASTAVGLAMGLKFHNKDARVYAVLGDGESNEGQVWEAALFAPAHKLNNLMTFVDYNKKQLDGTTDQVAPLGDIAKKYEEFGWYAVNVEQGNDPDVIAAAIEDAWKNNGDKPVAIILHTVKGSGIAAIEEIEYNHHINFGGEMADSAIAELEGRLANA